MLTAISIVRSGWRRDDEETGLDLALWRQFVHTTPQCRLVEHIRGADGRGNVMAQERPYSAVWSGHPTGAEYVFIWRIGRIEVGRADRDAGAEFALPVADKALRAACETVAQTLAATVEYTAWDTPDA